ncbi:MAG TPA: hypothetical protein VFS40_10780 [Gemmatimonadales bacterium]|nr:hypothetical protein [Gemmatimonadales bacterium]
MYVIVQHTVTDPAAFWSLTDSARLPAHLQLHHTFPTPDGRHAVCVWEADSVEDVRDLLEPMLGGTCRNEYFAVENREGRARPSGVPQAAGAGR